MKRSFFKNGDGILRRIEQIWRWNRAGGHQVNGRRGFAEASAPFFGLEHKTLVLADLDTDPSIITGKIHWDLPFDGGIKDWRRFHHSIRISKSTQIIQLEHITGTFGIQSGIPIK
ncbi:unnamed protein product [Arabis nemorensis]|uniref:Uncharacterized protein n=1 Tax=Arabis nemorensis TaxID=586526 RepID=A0A565BCN5_9BRAS|nr:unnamed protein product [Arabis nemorensis]